MPIRLKRAAQESGGLLTASGAADEHGRPLADEFGPAPANEFGGPPGNESGVPPENETGAPSARDYVNPPESMEFTPPGSTAGQERTGSRRRRLKRLCYAVAALALLYVMWNSRGEERTEGPLSPAPAESTEPAPIAAPGTAEEPKAEATAVPAPAETEAPAATPEPTPVTKEPELEALFFHFSHEHHGVVQLDNTAAVHSVRVLVRETHTDAVVYEKYLEPEDYAEGSFELPELSTGDFYMEHMEELDGAWPSFEMKVSVWYENEAGDGEELKEQTLKAAYELGFGVSYYRPQDDWDEDIPTDCFVIMPWEETNEIRFVLNDPEAVTDPSVISFDFTYGGRHLSKSEYSEAIDYEFYDTYFDGFVERKDYTAETKIVLIPRPDWVPESGTVHVTITQMLESTGELYTSEIDCEFPPVYDWE